MLKAVVLVIGLSALGCSRSGGGAVETERTRQLEAELAELRRNVAGANAYICTVVAAHDLQKDGTLRPGTKPMFPIGGVFTVDRDTGIFRGGGVPTNANYAKREVVFFPPANSYYVASITPEPGNFGSIQYLAVQDFTDGPLKPFILADFHYVLTGTCER